MSDAVPVQIDLEQEVRDLFRSKMEEFARFCAEHWQIADEAELQGMFPGKSADFREGYNLALTDGLTGAIECWFEGIGYV
jgi:hypothetical protein